MSKSNYILVVAIIVVEWYVAFQVGEMRKRIDYLESRLFEIEGEIVR